MAMAHAAVGHELHAVIDAVARRHGEYGRGHDLAHRRFRRRAALQDNLARVVAFGNDAEQLRTFHHQQRADVLVGHQADSIEHGFVRFDGVDHPTLVFEQMLDESHTSSAAARDPPILAQRGRQRPPALGCLGRAAFETAPEHPVGIGHNIESGRRRCRQHGHRGSLREGDGPLRARPGARWGVGPLAATREECAQLMAYRSGVPAAGVSAAAVSTAGASGVFVLVFV